MNDEENATKYTVRFVFKEKALDGVYSITVNFSSAYEFKSQWQAQVQSDNDNGFIKFELPGKQMSGWRDMLGIPLNNIAYFEHIAN